MSVNKVILLGFLGQDPACHDAQNGTLICNLSVATSRKFKDQQGNQQEETEWHRVCFFGKYAEVIQNYFAKGSAIYVEGRLRTRKYTDKQGVERYVTEIMGERFDFVGGQQKQQPTREVRQTNVRPVQQQQPQRQYTESDDCPF